jgi:2-polyprenyl-6-methoxyphenol hydroxylase-like FAD-dependent oxidoreductase
VKGPVAIVGAGYVGLPLAVVFADAGHRVVLVESNPDKVAAAWRRTSASRLGPS